MMKEILNEFENIYKVMGIAKLNRYPSEEWLLPKSLDLPKLWIKRDDKLQLGCSKQRSISYIINYYLKQNHTKFCVSSSGNAALVSAYIALKTPQIMHLQILLSKDISNEKLQKFITYLKLKTDVESLRSNFSIKNISFDFSVNPKQKALQLQNEEYVNLRGSVDDNALKGFMTISYEIYTHVHKYSHKPDAIFVPASSGTTAQGIYEGFKILKYKPQIHVVQSTKTYALVKKILNVRPEIEADHPAESIVDMIGHRRTKIEHIIKETSGQAWVITKRQAIEAKEELEKVHDINVSYDSALSYAAYKKALSQGYKFENPVLIFTG